MIWTVGPQESGLFCYAKEHQVRWLCPVCELFSSSLSLHLLLRSQWWKQAYPGCSISSVSAILLFAHHSPTMPLFHTAMFQHLPAIPAFSLFFSVSDVRIWLCLWTSNTRWGLAPSNCAGLFGAHQNRQIPPFPLQHDQANRSIRFAYDQPGSHHLNGRKRHCEKLLNGSEAYDVGPTSCSVRLFPFCCRDTNSLQAIFRKFTAFCCCAEIVFRWFLFLSAP